MPGGLDAVLNPLAEALDAAAECELWPSPDAELTAAAVACGRLVSRAQAVLCRVLGEIDARDLGVRSGASSTAAWTRHELNVTPREAQTMTRVGAALHRGRPATAAAFAAGRVSLSQAAVILTTIEDLPEDLPRDVTGQAESELLGYARRFDAGQLTRLGQHLLTVIAPEIGEARDAAALDRQEQQARRRRGLFLIPDGHGRVHLRGRLTDAAAAVVRAALDSLSAPLPAGADGPDPRTPAQRRADALTELARRALGRDGRDGFAVGAPTAGPTSRPATRPATQVAVTVPLRTLIEGLGAATLPDGTRLSPGAARRMACDSDLTPAVLGGDSAVLDVGRRQRLFTGARRQALILRDRGCAFPGCDRPPEWCDGHHILGFAQGGSTAVDNGVLICGHHHHVVHHDGWDVVLVRDGTPEFIPPAWIDPTRTPRRNHRNE